MNRLTAIVSMPLNAKLTRTRDKLTEAHGNFGLAARRLLTSNRVTCPVCDDAGAQRAFAGPLE